MHPTNHIIHPDKDAAITAAAVAVVAAAVFYLYFLVIPTMMVFFDCSSSLFGLRWLFLLRGKRYIHSSD